MKGFYKVCGGIGVVCWSILCLGAALGYVTIDVGDYCVATGTLAYMSLVIFVKGVY